MANDILLKDFDLSIIGGDLDVGYSDEQHMEHILLAHPGHYKQTPWIGIGIEDLLNAPTNAKTIRVLERDIKLQLESDGAKNVTAKSDINLNLKIDATYE